MHVGIVLAAGKGIRMGGDKPKVLLEINHRPALYYSLKAFDQCDDIAQIILVCPKGCEIDYTNYVQSWRINKVSDIICGGDNRGESVKNGLSLVPDGCKCVAIHDGARPMVTVDAISKLLRTGEKEDGAIIGRPVHNTIKYTKDHTTIDHTVDRSTLWEVYTPQVFQYDKLLEAYQRAQEANYIATDDAAIMEYAGYTLSLVDCGYRDIKLTTKEDVQLIESIFKTHALPKSGIGYDVHRLVEGRDLILGGVTIPYEKGLLGHSDADVLTHAIMDALLGAAGLPDIGRLFPDNDPSYKGADSIKLLEVVGQRLHGAGYIPDHIDTVIICQRPKLSPHVDAMKKHIANALNIANDCINIKATTTEGLGFEGRGEGIAAQAIVTIVPTNH